MDKGTTFGGSGGALALARPPVQTEDELESVKKYVLLGVVMRVLDHDIRSIGASAIKLPRLYESMLRGVQDRVLLDQAALRKRFKEKGIKLLEERRGTDGVDVDYVCRGYRHTFRMLWSHVKAESERVLKRYFQA
ncbi:hypothetical protein [Paenibacillus sp. NPDC058071]|uniref:hypothetical protein n=1 Tax=Paenibacillus sp. NPDC058071 TaxID=3346326 RepID=UPI0036D8938A